VTAINPYAPPQLPDGQPEASELTRMRPLRALGRWTLVCGLSAAPSFFWGCTLHHGTEHISAMLCGIGIFVLAYTALECSDVYRQVISAPYVRRTLQIGYGTRLLLSLLFPLGLGLDVFLGLIAVGLVQATMSVPYGAGQASAVPFGVVLLTTLVQGVLLNLVLVAYMALVFAVQWGLGARLRRRGDPLQGRAPSGGGAGGS